MGLQRVRHDQWRSLRSNRWVVKEWRMHSQERMEVQKNMADMRKSSIKSEAGTKGRGGFGVRGWSKGPLKAIEGRGVVMWEVNAQVCSRSRLLGVGLREEVYKGLKRNKAGDRETNEEILQSHFPPAESGPPQYVVLPVSLDFFQWVRSTIIHKICVMYKTYCRLTVNWL